MDKKKFKRQISHCASKAYRNFMTFPFGVTASFISRTAKLIQNCKARLFGLFRDEEVKGWPTQRTCSKQREYSGYSDPGQPQKQCQTFESRENIDIDIES